MKIFNKLQYIVLYVVSFLIIGITSVISGDLKWDSFKDALFYVQNALTYAAIICIIIATLLMVIDRFKQTNQEYLEGSTKIQKFAATTYVPTVFSQYCDYANRKRKIKQFIYNTKRELLKLEHKAKESDLYAWNHDREQAIKNGNTYCLKRTRLEEMLNPVWIEENIDNKIVKYDRITAGIILGGEFDKVDSFAVNEYITKHKAAKVVRDKMPMVILSFGITCFISSLFVGFNFNASSLITFFTKLLVLCFNTFMTIRYANTYTETVTLKDIRFRKGIVHEYNLWVVKQAQPKPTEIDKAYEEMKKEAESKTPEEKSLTQKLISATPIGAAIDIIKEAKKDGTERSDAPSDQTTADV